MHTSATLAIVIMSIVTTKDNNPITTRLGNAHTMIAPGNRLKIQKSDPMQFQKGTLERIKYI